MATLNHPQDTENFYW